MECSCVRHTDLPGTSKLFADLLYHFDRVEDLYPYRPNDIRSLEAASRFDFPNERRAALVHALTPLNEGNPSLERLARPGTVAVVTGQQVGLFSGPVYTVYKALTAIKAAAELTQRGTPAVPVFWLATEDHDLAEVNHAWVFGADHRPVHIKSHAIESKAAQAHNQPVGGIGLGNIPLPELEAAVAGLPFAPDAVAMVERAYRPGETMGSAFARFLKELFQPYGLLLIDPLEPAIREMAAPLLMEAVERMPELSDALVARSKDLTARGYHAQVLVDQSTSLVFLLHEGKRIALRRSEGGFTAPHLKLTTEDLAARGSALSPNALLRPVMQDYLLPTAAYIGGPAELAYLAQSQVLYAKLLGRQPAALPRACFTLLDERSHRYMVRYGLHPADLFAGERKLHETIATRLVPRQLRARLDGTQAAFKAALDALKTDLDRFDASLASALGTSRRKIEYQMEKMVRKTALRIMARDEQATRDAGSLSGLAFPERHLQERLYSIVPFIAKFGPGIVDKLYSAVRIECPDHQFVVV
ncbi:MAG: bacillithiol biosynthesis cysteine-adding enzyme BshC [Acidobacteriota bacterium]|nr:bacillithiol biosynthesis cysteine-adding enzyme BshC [Acidobacteriota bacterium]